MRKIGIIGMGHVGSTLAHIVIDRGMVDEIVLLDINQKHLKAEALDFWDAQSFLPHHTKIIAGDYKDLADANLIVSTFGNVNLTAESGDRFAELQFNVKQIRSMAEQLKKVHFDGVFLTITNPVDVITAVYQRELALPKNQVIGTGTFLDSSRLKKEIGERFKIDPRSVSGFVIGEHGNSQFPAWSSIRIFDNPISSFAKENSVNIDDLEEKTKEDAFRVIDGKGYTNIAIATAAATLIEMIVSDSHSEVIVSHYNKKFGIYISLPAIIGRKGIVKDIYLPLDQKESTKLKTSAESIIKKTKLFE
ncbi:putative L-lactate dehydrogenase [Oenococcus oeni]|uniref:L-lactate dehydrogenase n=2 Tax=Oenococcus oeni TaxID=1247 RepID=A0AAQ2UUU7_OENOE|nr:L-lactate dehydrogenase [Oenococcus oeni]OIL38745.1 L-lactate dehydrogenase [Oenococcus oeni]SYW07810.1 putative L-lactate dehydrogenase [Oenococcus oeni]SYW20732.1 putative L-lactate dehydrogenase [Oenococcus oeni]VDB97549.1 putative L-lactate dehydrogenase [Oenococcus oeni]